MKEYRLEEISDDGKAYLAMIEYTETELKTQFGDVDSAKMIAGTHSKWHLAETLEVPDPPTE